MQIPEPQQLQMQQHITINETILYNFYSHNACKYDVKVQADPHSK
jgi:hypothetical protein